MLASMVHWLQMYELGKILDPDQFSKIEQFVEIRSFRGEMVELDSKDRLGNCPATRLIFLFFATIIFLFLFDQHIVKHVVKPFIKEAIAFQIG